MDVSNLVELASNLPEQYSQTALDLLERMSATVEGIGDGDIEWKPPILKVVQATTDRSSLPKGTSIGDLVIGDEKIDQPLAVIPLRLWDSRQMWSPDKDDNRILCWSPDATTGITGQACKTCPHQVFDTENNRVDCTKNKTVMSITSDLRHIFVSNFAKTNYANGMEWQNLMKKAGVSPYRRQYQLATEASKKHKNVEALIATPMALPAGHTPEELKPFVEALFTMVSENRKEHLTQFKEMATARAGQLALAAPESDPQGLIEATAEPVSSEQSDMGTKYTL